MRVTLTAADGTNVEIRVPGPYSRDVFDDLCNRAADLLGDRIGNLEAATLDEPVQR